MFLERHFYKSDKKYGWTCIFILFIFFQNLLAFNLDVDSAIVFTPNYKSNDNGAKKMFGFSVASHIVGDTSWVIVGAPEDVNFDQEKLGLEKTGAVYKCQTNPPYMCSQIPFDTRGNNIILDKIIDDKSNQWFGATVQSSGKDGFVVACAPRYIYTSINHKRREPVGTCFISAKNFTKFTEYSPCRSESWGFHRQGYCQVGFSSAAYKNRLFIGAVGSWYWQGQIFLQNINNRLDIKASKEGSSSQDNQYMGYSLALGDFTGRQGRLDVAVGMPRGANLTGKVIFLTGRRLLQIPHELQGQQVGAYFGYSLAVFDANGDGLDDIAIGAPFHVTSSGSTISASQRYDTGRVYVVYQNKERAFHKWDIIDGRESVARFGHSLTSLGDIDRDGYDDLAIGAPYGGPRDEGTVYIYRGSSEGIQSSASQIIIGLGIRTANHDLRGFGFSLSGSVDLDQNGYPDLIIGSPDSDQAIYIRSRAVVHVETSVRLESEDTGLLDEEFHQIIDPDNKTCSLFSGLKVVCLTLQGCIKYDGVGVDPSIDFIIYFALDTKKPRNGRLFFLTAENQSKSAETVTLRKNKKLCKRSYIYLKPEIRDKLTRLDVEMTYNISNNVLRDGKPSSILNPDESQRITHYWATIRKNCGSDNICVPDLVIQFSSSSLTYLVGSNSRIELHWSVTNHGEDAYEAEFLLQLPSFESNNKTNKHQNSLNYSNKINSDSDEVNLRIPGVDYIKTEMISSVHEGTSKPTTVLCSPPTKSNGFLLVCELGNPMTKNSEVDFRVILQPNFYLGEMSSLHFLASARSSNNEDETHLVDNFLDISIPVVVETDIRIRGLSEPAYTRFNTTTYSSLTLEEIKLADDIRLEVGPEITHIYQLQNEGPSDILLAQIAILWPSFRADGSPLLYMMQQPIIEGGSGFCKHVDDVNILNLEKELHENVRTSDSYSAAKIFEFRRKRQATMVTQSFVVPELDCGDTKCTLISCTVGPLRKKEHVLFKIRSRLWTKTLLNISPPRKYFDISSRLVAQITSLPHGADPSYLKTRSQSVTTNIEVVGIGDSSTNHVPLWILILATLAGLLFLSLLSFLLWWLGFFSRSAIPVNANDNNLEINDMEEEDEAFSMQGSLQHERQPLAYQAKQSVGGIHINGKIYNNGNGKLNQIGLQKNQHVKIFQSGDALL